MSSWKVINWLPTTNGRELCHKMCFFACKSWQRRECNQVLSEMFRVGLLVTFTGESPVGRQAPAASHVQDTWRTGIYSDVNFANFETSMILKIKVTSPLERVSISYYSRSLSRESLTLRDLQYLLPCLLDSSHSSVYWTLFCHLYSQISQATCSI